MRNIIGGVFLTLDGVMQGPGGPTEDATGGFEEGGWVFKLWDEAAGDAAGALFAGEYDLLLGRRTYDIFAAYWPYVEGVTAKGTVIATYVTGGTLPVFPPFGPQPSTSSRETDRQRRMAQGSW